MDNINPATVTILTNAIYFKSSWAYEFDKSKTESKTFYNADGTTSTVPMMYQEYQMDYNIQYSQMDVCGMAAIPFGNNAFCMNLILPAEGIDLDALVDEIDGVSWHEMMKHRAVTTKLTLFMPRFKIENTLVGLADILATMGMPLVCSADSADFSNMVDNIQKLFVSDVIQKSYISVDEKAAEAAAVTIIATLGMARMPDPLEVTMVLDRPFLFAITERSTRAILFMGKVTAL